MIVDQVKDVLESEGNWLISERRIPYGRRLEYRGGTSVNVYETGTYQVLGKKDTDIRLALAEAEQRLEAGLWPLPKDVPRLDRVSVPGIISVLKAGRYQVQQSKRLPNSDSTQLRLKGGPIVTVYENGTYTIQGKYTGMVEALLNYAMPWYEGPAKRRHRGMTRPFERNEMFDEE